jgi:exosortase/archaeosortase family protein
MLALGVLVAAGVVAVAMAAQVRTAEAYTMATLVGWSTGTSTHVVPGTAAFYWLLGTPRAQGLRITSECSIAYVLGPLLVLCGLLATLRRLPLRRVFAAASVGAALITVVNLLRMTMVALAVTHSSSERAMWWWHTVVGSLVSILGIGLGLAAVGRIAFSGRTPAEHRPTPAVDPAGSSS